MNDRVHYKKNPDVSWRNIDGNAVLVHNQLGEVLVLNEVGTFAWQHFEEGLDAIVDRLAAEYDIGRSEAAADLEAFIEELLAAEAISAEEPQAE